MKQKGHDRSAQKKRERKKHRRSVRKKTIQHRQPPRSTRLAEYSALLAGYRSPDAELVARLKGEHPSVLRDLVRKALPASEQWTGAQFPATYNGFGRQLPLTPGASLEDELRWTAIVLSLFSGALTRFVSAKNDFDSLLIVGDYEEARAAYNRATKDCGVSLWSMEAGFLLAEYEGGLQGNRKFLQEVLAWRPNPLPSLAATFFGLRVERRVSADTASAYMRNFIAQVGSAGPPGLTDYLSCRFGVDALDRPLDYRHVIFIDTINTIVDRYLSFVRVMQSLVASPRIGSSVRMAVADALRDLDQINDGRLLLLRQAIHPGEAIAATPLETMFMSAIDRYTIGDYRSSAAKCATALKLHPHNLELHRLYVKSCLYQGSKVPAVFPPGSIGDAILLDVEALLSRARDTRASADHLRKVAAELDSLDLGRQLRCFVEERAGRGTADLERLEMVIQSLRTPRCAELFEDSVDADTYLATLQTSFENNAGVSLFRAVANGTTELEVAIPTTRRLQYEARRLRASGDVVGAIERYRALLDLGSDTPPVIEAAIVGIYESYLAAERNSDALALVIDVYSKWPHLLGALDTTRLVRRYDDAQGPPPDIRWPIVAFLTYGKATAKDQEQLAEFLEDYLEANGVLRPSELLPVSESEASSLLILLLREVCVPSVIDFSEAYDSSDELDAERLAVCQALRQLDPTHSEQYAAEAAELTHSMALRQVIQTVTQSKLQVDVAAILSGFDEVFWERLARYQAFLSLAAALRKEVSVQPGKENVDVYLVLADKTVVDVQDSAELQFAQIFRDVNKGFLFGESGLDTQLSVRIRHGTLQGQLRSQFESEHLMTRIGRTPGHYGENIYWRQRVFQPLGSRLEREADNRLREFSAEVDSIISLVKDEWLQIRGAEKPSGLFDFDYSGDEIRTLYKSIGQNSDHKALVAEMLAELSLRTERSIEKVIASLRGPLNDRLIAALDRMAASIFALHPSIEHGEFGKAVALCRTRVGNGLEMICAWFITSDNLVAPDVSPDLVVRTGVEVVRRGFPGVDFAPSVTLDDIGIIAGRCLRAVNDVLFILFENVIKHGVVGDSKISVTVESGTIRLVVENAVPADADFNAIGDSIAAIPQGTGAVAQPGAASGEGKSGYHKLHKILRYGLSCGDNYSISVALDAGRFVATVTFRSEGVIV